MTLDEYQRLAARTRTSSHGALDPNSMCCNALGLAGESGEAVDLIKKHLFHGHPLDRVKLVKEIGDTLWYLASIASDLGVDLSEVAAQNLAKLETRYPNGFTEADSLARRDAK